MEYKECGNTCRATCAQPQSSQPCEEHCESGCFCPAGELLQSQGPAPSLCIQPSTLTPIPESQPQRDLSPFPSCSPSPETHHIPKHVFLSPWKKTDQTLCEVMFVIFLIKERCLTTSLRVDVWLCSSATANTMGRLTGLGSPSPGHAAHGRFLSLYLSIRVRNDHFAPKKSYLTYFTLYLQSRSGCIC